MPSFYRDQSRQITSNNHSQQNTHSITRLDSVSQQASIIFYQITWQFPQEIKVNFISFNAAAILGISAEKIMNDYTLFIQGIYPEDWQRLKSMFKSLSESLAEREFFFRFVTPNQSIKWLSTQIQLFCIDQQTFLLEGILQEKPNNNDSSFCENLDQKLANKLASDFAYFIYIYDLKQQEYIYLNQGLKRILGHQEEKPLSAQQWIDAVHPDDRDRLHRYHQNLLSLSDDDLITVQYRIQDNQGKWKWLNSILQVFSRRADHVPSQVMGTAYDITPYKKMKSILRRQRGAEKLINAISRRIHQSLQLDKIVATSVAELRKFLQVDRVFIYRFKPDWSGIVIAESVVFPWRSLLGKMLVDQEFIKHYLPDYQQGKIQVTTDIYKGELSQCYLNWLAQLQIRANVVIPILQNNELWGLLVAQNCQSQRSWQRWEIECLKQISLHIGIALGQERLYRELQLYNEELKKLVFIDGLTNVANRRYFDERFEQEWKRMVRQQQSLCLILCDVDFFKQYNDTYGHLAGDLCLQKIAQLMKQTLKRSSDLVARYGGEEFAIILPNTDILGGVHVANEIRSRLRALKLEHRGSKVAQQITLSFGIVSGLPTPQTSQYYLLEQADRTLYQAKQQGRDRMAITSLAGGEDLK